MSTLIKRLRKTKEHNTHKATYYVSFVSEGSDESKATKIDISALEGNPEKVRLLKIKYWAYNLGFQVFTKHKSTPANDIVMFACGNGTGEFDLTEEDKKGFIGLGGGGDGGDILLSTVNAQVESAYILKIEIMWGND